MNEEDLEEVWTSMVGEEVWTSMVGEEKCWGVRIWEFKT